jgi:DNA-binding MarR family transcriptional regulator
MALFCRKNYGLEPNLYLILLAASEGHLQQGILARSLGIHKNAMVFMIDNLELRRLIKRVPNPDNRRERFVECTLKGHRSLRRPRLIIPRSSAGDFIL